MSLHKLGWSADEVKLDERPKQHEELEMGDQAFILTPTANIRVVAMIPLVVNKLIYTNISFLHTYVKSVHEQD